MSHTSRLYLRALQLRCPACGGRPVFVAWFRMCPNCPSCGLHFDREPEGGYWVGSYTINLMLTEAALAAAFLLGMWATWPQPPWDLLVYGDIAVAALVIETGAPAGRGVDRAVPTEWQFHAVKSGSSAIAAMGFARDDGAPAVDARFFQLLDNLLDQVALALERGRLEGEAREFARTRERDRVRSTLLSTIGQDITPSLKAIGGAVRALKRSGTADKEVVSGIGSEAAKLERYVANLFDGGESDHSPLQVDGLTIDLFKRMVLRSGEEVHLTPKEYAVLAELAKHPGRVLSHAHLLRTAWGPAQENQIDYLRVAVRALRQKLERNPAEPQLIINEPAVGYRLNSD